MAQKMMPGKTNQPAAGGKRSNSDMCSIIVGRNAKVLLSAPTASGQKLPGWLWLGMLCFLLGAPWSVYAEDTGVPWNQLGPEEQKVLEPYADRWDSMPPNKQKRLIGKSGFGVLASKV